MAKSFENEHDKQIAIARLQASNACLALYEDFYRVELLRSPPSILRAWDIGEKLYVLILDGEE